MLLRLCVLGPASRHVLQGCAATVTRYSTDGQRALSWLKTQQRQASCLVEMAVHAMVVARALHSRTRCYVTGGWLRHGTPTSLRPSGCAVRGSLSESIMPRAAANPFKLVQPHAPSQLSQGGVAQITGATAQSRHSAIGGKRARRGMRPGRPAASWPRPAAPVNGEGCHSGWVLVGRLGSTR